MKNTFRFMICAVTIFVGLSGAALAKEKLVVYTSLENEEVVEYLALARKTMPDLDIQAIRLSTGELGARMLAEKDNPQHDVIFGWGGTNTAEFKAKGMLQPYKPKGWDIIPAHFKDPEGYWTGMSIYGSAFIYNKKVIEKKNLPIPKSWADLLNPVYKDQLIMPNPASSGTGFLMIAGLLATMDPDYKNKPVKDNKAWDYLKKLDKNMGQYIKSGSKPAKLTAAGEYAVGLSFAFVQLLLTKKGFPVGMVIPAEGFAYEMEVSSLPKGAKNVAGAKRFLDFAISKPVAEINSKYKIGVSYPGFSGPDLLPKLADMKLMKMDFSWQAEHRSEIANVWTSLFQR